MHLATIHYEQKTYLFQKSEGNPFFFSLVKIQNQNDAGTKNEVLVKINAKTDVFYYIKSKISKVKYKIL